MKKFITVLLAITMVLVSTISAFAAPAGFVESPSDDTPSLVSYENESDECEAELIVTPFSKVDELDDAKEQENRDAYDDIVNNNTSLLEALKKLAAMKNMSVEDLAVSELFDVSYYESAGHNEHGAFTITIKAKNLDKFVGLLHCDNGSWEVVEAASANGDTLTFTVDDLSPFAIVVDTGDGSDVKIPNTNVAGISAQTLIFAAAVIVLSSAIVLVIRKKTVKE